MTGGAGEEERERETTGWAERLRGPSGPEGRGIEKWAGRFRPKKHFEFLNALLI